MPCTDLRDDLLALPGTFRYGSCRDGAEQPWQLDRPEVFLRAIAPAAAAAGWPILSVHRFVQRITGSIGASHRHGEVFSPGSPMPRPSAGN